jgi:hypothetical protein
MIESEPVEVHFRSVVALPDGTLRFGIKIGDRTYFRKVGEEAAGFRLVAHREIRNPAKNVKVPFLATLDVRRAAETLTITNGSSCVFGGQTPEARPAAGDTTEPQAGAP